MDYEDIRPKLFMVQYDDNDYYCEREHVLGIYPTREAAEAAIAETKKTNKFKADYVYTIGEWTVGETVDVFGNEGYS